MDYRILNKLCYLLHNPDKLLCSSKYFTVKRFRNIRWKNRIYFKDNSIKIVKYNTKNYCIICKEIWCKDGKLHRDDIDFETGHTFPAEIGEDKTKHWCKDGKYYRGNVDFNTGLTLPAIILIDGSKSW